MTPETTERQDVYYQQRGISPTYKGLASVDELRAYERQRVGLFRDKLALPPQLFRGLQLVEFGPDAGENALVFARWGASMTLVEPNPNAWGHILDYFERFGLQERLRALIKIDLERFETAERFDGVIAEGFVYTIRPDTVWIELFRQILKADGFFIISYNERFGSLLDLTLRALYTRAKALLGLDGEALAATLFQTKWDAIPHTRALGAWVIDMLENPSVRLRYCFDAQALCARLWDAGFALYSSWPSYHDSLRVYWHKTELPPAERLAQQAWWIARGRLSFAFGRKLFLCAEADGLVASAQAALSGLLESVDRLIDGFDADALARGAEALDAIARLVATGPVLADSAEDRREALCAADSLGRALRLLAAKDGKGLVTFCNTDPAFIRTWGVPAHFAVFRHAELPTEGGGGGACSEAS